ncbi:MAG: universal stress protein [Thermodesulfobacteriota bacterium]|nr:universal stress protein [Thermodesulfobacteriota bacterium]
MEARKLLYATDLKDQSLSVNMLKETLPVGELDFESIAFLQTVPFDSCTKGLSDLNIKSKIILDDQLLPHRILNAAKNEGASLIVVNLQKKEVKTSRNSIIKQLIKDSSVPLIFINHANHKTKTDKRGMFAHIVFATDWSPKSEKALAFLLGFKKMVGEMEIVNVIKGKLTIKEMRELKTRLADTRKICLDNEIDAESHIYAGNTSEEIQTAAKDYKGTMIIIGGESRKKGLRSLFNKSSAGKVACEAELPVLVVP